MTKQSGEILLAQIAPIMDNEHVMDSVRTSEWSFTFPVILLEILLQTRNVDGESSDQIESMNGVSHKSVNILLVRLILAAVQ